MGRKRTRATENNYLGVYLDTFYRKQGLPFCARIRILGEHKYIGCYPTEREAAIAYDKVAIKYGMETNILKLKAA